MQAWWRLGLRAPLVAGRNYSLTIFFFLTLDRTLGFLSLRRQPVDLFSKIFYSCNQTNNPLDHSQSPNCLKREKIVFILWLLLTRSPSLTLCRKATQHVQWNPSLKGVCRDGFNTTANHTKKSSSRRPQILSERKASFYLFYFLTCLTALTPKTRRAQTSISFYCESGLTGSSI